MRKLLFLLFFSFYSLGISCFECDSLEELRKTFCIENQILTTATGNTFTRYPFECRLHFELSYALKDLKMANQIYEAYKLHLLPILIQPFDDNTFYIIHHAFSKALIQVCHYFGSPNFSPLESLIKALDLQDQAAWTELHATALSAFVADASAPLYPSYEKKTDGPFTVAVISTTCSGGNDSTARSVASLLALQPNVRTIIIDVEELAQEHDPVMIATNTYTYDMIYSHILQKTNELNIIKKRKLFCREIQTFIPNNLLHVLKEKILLVNPDLIISTRSYTCDDISLATLGIPFRLFHPDYELCPSLCSYYRSVPSDKVRFWIPSVKPMMFKPLFQHMNREDLYNERDGHRALFKKLGTLMNTTSKNAKSHFELIGYPCENFYEISNKTLLQKKWGITSSEIAIFIVMGKHSTASMQNIFHELREAKTNYPFKFFFICGKNATLQNELQESAPSSMVICGLLTPQEMNEIMNLSSLGISKAGGATVSEAVATRTPLLLVDSYPWEEINATYLIELGLAKKADPKVPLIEQIERCLRELRVKNTKQKDWRSHVIEKINIEIDKKSLSLK